MISKKKKKIIPHSHGTVKQVLIVFLSHSNTIKTYFNFGVKAALNLLILFKITEAKKIYKEI